MKDIIKAGFEALKHLPDTVKQFGRKTYIMPFFTIMICAIVIVVTFCIIAYAIVDANKEEFGKAYFEEVGREHFVARFDETKFNVEISALGCQRCRVH